MYGECLLVADVGEIEYHRHAEELVAPLADDGTTPSDDGLGEMVVKWYAVVAESHGGVAIDDERGQGGNVQQPTLAGHVVVAIACTETDVRHLQLHLLIPVEGGVLTHARRCQQEAARAAGCNSV